MSVADMLAEAGTECTWPGCDEAATQFFVYPAERGVVEAVAVCAVHGEQVETDA